MPQSDKHFDFAFGGGKFLEIFRRCGKHALLPVPGCLPLHTLQCSLFPSPCPINFYCLIPQECGGTQSPRCMVSVIKSYCHNPSLLKKCSAPLRTCPPRTGCTPAFPLGSLDAIFFTTNKWLQECLSASVTAP